MEVPPCVKGCDPRAPACAEQVTEQLQSRSAAVQAGKYVAVLPSEALPRVIGEGGARMQALCAGLGCQVEIEPLADVVCVAIHAHAQVR